MEGSRTDPFDTRGVVSKSADYFTPRGPKTLWFSRLHRQSSRGSCVFPIIKHHWTRDLDNWRLFVYAPFILRWAACSISPRPRYGAPGTSWTGCVPTSGSATTPSVPRRPTHPRELRRSRRHQPGGHPPPATGPTMSTLTPDVLSTGSSTITSLFRPSHAGSITLVTGDMRRGLAPLPRPVIPLSKHVSARFFSITNWS